MNTYADLELSLHRLDSTCYQVDFRFSQPASDADIRFGADDQARAIFDFEKLAERQAMQFTSTELETLLQKPGPLQLENVNRPLAKVG